MSNLEIIASAQTEEEEVITLVTPVVDTSVVSTFSTTITTISRTAASSGKRGLLPTSAAPCQVCRKRFCQLPTHRRYIEDLKLKRLGISKVQLSLQIGGSRVDPFAKHPVTVTPELDRLLKQCYVPWNTDFKGPERHLFPRPRYNAALQESCDDPALFIGMLSVIATQTSLMRNGKIDELALKLQNDTIKLQAKACLRSVSDDGRILTAMIIMSNQMASGKPEEMIPHMRAITSFVKQRGGLQNLGMDGLVADNLMFADHAKAVLYNNRPSYQFVLPSLQPETRSPSFVRYLGYGFEALLKSGHIDQPLYDVARDISLLNDIYDKATLRKATSQEATYFAYLESAVEFQLAELNALNHETDELPRLLTLAFLLIVHTIFRNYGNVSPVMPTLEQRFWHCYEEVRHQDLSEVPNRSELLLWLAFTGVVFETRRKSMFITSAVDALVEIKRENALQLESFRDVQRVLDMYVWSCPVVEHVFNSIWQQACRQYSFFSCQRSDQNDQMELERVESPTLG